MNKTGFIVNGRRSIVHSFNREFGKYCKDLEGEYNVLTTSEQGHAKRLARELANDGYTHLVAVGGDGTLHEVVNGVMTSDNQGCRIGLLPAGTANDYARTVGSQRSLIQLIKSVNLDSIQHVNLGKIVLEDGHIEYFINIADMGLGVDVVQRVNRSGKILGPSLTFSKAILQSFLTYKNQEVAVKTKAWSWEGKINSLVVASGKYFGSGMCIAPDASVEGDAFSVVIIGDVRIRDYLKYVGQIKKGQKIDHPEVQYKTAKYLDISSKSGIEADGEYIGEAPKTIELLRGQLNFLVRSTPLY